MSARFLRQRLLPEIGNQGQAALSAARLDAWLADDEAIPGPRRSDHLADEHLHAERRAARAGNHCAPVVQCLADAGEPQASRGCASGGEPSAAGTEGKAVDPHHALNHGALRVSEVCARYLLRAGLQSDPLAASDGSFGRPRDMPAATSHVATSHAKPAAREPGRPPDASWERSSGGASLRDASTGPWQRVAGVRRAEYVAQSEVEGAADASAPKSALRWFDASGVAMPSAKELAGAAPGVAMDDLTTAGTRLPEPRSLGPTTLEPTLVSSTWFAGSVAAVEVVKAILASAERGPGARPSTNSDVNWGCEGEVPARK